MELEQNIPERLQININRWKVKDESFKDLSNCPDKFISYFFEAWKAIERGSVMALKDLMKSMKVAYECKCGDHGPTSSCGKYLDVCSLCSTVSRHRKKQTYYYMTLLSYAAVNKRMNMVGILLEDNADLRRGSKNTLTGNPLSQMLIYCLHHGCSEVIDSKIVDSLMNGKYVPNDLNIIVASYMPHDTCDVNWYSSLLEVPIDMKRFDIAAKLVKSGADPIDARGTNGQGVVALLEEYYQFGTNNYIRWLLYEHYPPSKVSEFIDRVMETDIFNKKAVKHFDEKTHRHHAHALLTCGHEQMIRRLIVKMCPTTVEAHNLLRSKDNAERTALEISADEGDLESVQVLMKLRKEYSLVGEDIARAFLAAARKKDTAIVRCILKHHIEVIWIDVTESKKNVWEIAISEGLSSVFEVIRQLDEGIWLEEIDEKMGSTLGHIAASRNLPDVFKVVFPLRKERHDCFEPLRKQNKDEKTALEIAVENDYDLILKTLHDRAIERKSKASEFYVKEDDEWEKFWHEWGPKLLLLACRCGSLESVKLLVGSMGCLSKFENEKDISTLLSRASEGGKDQVLKYLLDIIKKVPGTKDGQPSPLLLAAQSGYRRCVKILLTHGANVEEKDKNGDNCLMLAIKNRHRKIVLTILSDDEVVGSKALRCHTSYETEHLLYRTKSYTTPMRMLIEEMPEIAEFVLDKCAMSKSESISDSTDDGNGAAHRESPNNTGYNLKELLSDTWPDGPQKEDSDRGAHPIYKLEKYCRKRCGSKRTYIGGDEPDMGSDFNKFTIEDPPEHPIELMVKHEREDLLHHPLIKTWIQNEYYGEGLANQLMYMFVYGVFLAFLTAFAVLLPRPNQTGCCCGINNNTAEVNLSATDNYTDSQTCEGSYVEPDSTFLLLGSITILIFSFFFCLLEVYQMILRHKRYFTDIANLVQFSLFPLSIVFALPISDECWCLPSSRWHIGAVAVFLAWVNVILELVYVPLIGSYAVQLKNVYKNFIKLMLLPILLILSFALPFYMLIVQEVPTVEVGDSCSSLVAFTTPAYSIRKVFIEMVGQSDAQTILTTTLVYPGTSHILFTLFLIAGPILFNNFLIGMAVGEISKEREKAKFKHTKRKVEVIFDIRRTYHGSIVRFVVSTFRMLISKCLCCFHCSFCNNKKEDGRKKEIEDRKSVERINSHTEDIEDKSRIEDTHLTVLNLTKAVSKCQESLKHIQQQNEGRVTPVVGKNIRHYPKV